MHYEFIQPALAIIRHITTIYCLFYGKCTKVKYIYFCYNYKILGQKRQYNL